MHLLLLSERLFLAQQIERYFAEADRAPPGIPDT